MKLTGNAIMDLLVRIICACLIFWLLKWLIDYVGMPQPFNKVANVVLVVGAVLFLVNELRALFTDGAES